MATTKVDGVVGVAVIGSGGIFGAHSRGFVKHREKIECVALCDIRPEAMEARAKQLGYEPRRFADWKVMLKEMGGEIDAVDICLPHCQHGEAILDACAAGVHVLCEKPMCISLKEADAIAKAVKKAGVTYMSGHQQLFMPVVREAKKRTAASALLAAGVARAAGELDWAAELLADAEPLCTGDDRARWENEGAALAWHHGDSAEALTRWEALADSPAVRFNRGMALLFLGRYAEARTLLTAAVEALPEESGWRDLAELYRTLSEIHG